MKKYLISYATREHYKNQEYLTRSAYAFGVDEVISYREDSFSKDAFYRDNKEILDQKRGAGYWLWKPYLIAETLKTIPENEILIYSDSGNEIISSLDHVLEVCDKISILTFNVGTHINKYWTKRDCFVRMNCDSERYWDGRQRRANFIMFKNNTTSRVFVDEWLSYCTDKNILTDIPNVSGLPNFPEFKDHRHDQSVLSLLAIKYDLETLPDPYLKIINCHRTKYFPLWSKVLQKIKRIIKK